MVSDLCPQGRQNSGDNVLDGIQMGAESNRRSRRRAAENGASSLTAGKLC
jgi:hypothetical protein